MGVKLATATINTGGRNRVKIEDLFDLAKFESTDFKTVRPVGDIFALGTHWFEVITKDGKKTRIGKTCRNVKLDGELNVKGYDNKGGCGFCAVGHQPRTGYFTNVIDVDDADNAPRKMAPPTPEEKKSGFKLKGTKLWTPVCVLVFPPTIATTMQLLTKKNKDKAGTQRELSDPNFGRALDISKNTAQGVSPANMWNLQKADVAMRKLTDEQKEYWLWDLNLLGKMYPSPKESLEDMKYNVPTMVDADFENLDLTDYPELLAKRKGGKKSKSGSFQAEEDDDDDDDLPKSKRKASKYEDEDEDDDLPRRGKKKASRQEDDDDDDDLPVRKKKKKKSFNISDVF